MKKIQPHVIAKNLAFTAVFATGFVLILKKRASKNWPQKKRIRGDKVEETFNPPGDNSS